MKPPRLEVADVFRLHRGAFLARWGPALSSQQRKVVFDIARCRTSMLGGHVRECDRCGHREIAYNSCRNRHCPKCQAAARQQWLRARSQELLPVPYFHLVFTLPQPLAPLALQNPGLIYGLLFRAASHALLTIAADPRRLGARIGFLAVLHTWGQNLHHHPHLHCVVPGGGLAPDGSGWIAAPGRFFLPVRVLSRMCRGAFLNHLQRAYRQRQIRFTGHCAAQAGEAFFRKFIRKLFRTEWIVYAKPPFATPENVLSYLARYTHRVALSNDRLLSAGGGRVCFRWKDYAHGGKRKVMSLDGVEFMRRFLLHVLPAGFVKIRYFGILANRCRHEALLRCRQLLAAHPPLGSPAREVRSPQGEALRHEWKCPQCGLGVLVIIETLPPGLPAVSPACRPGHLDSSSPERTHSASFFYAHLHGTGSSLPGSLCMALPDCPHALSARAFPHAIPDQISSGPPFARSAPSPAAPPTRFNTHSSP